MKNDIFIEMDKPALLLKVWTNFYFVFIFE